jgi:hypothetical protein
MKKNNIMKAIHDYLVLFLLVLAFTYCSKNNDTVKLNGRVYGRVQAIDKMNNFINDPTSINIRFQGTGYNKTIHPDSHGSYFINDLPLGTYKITYLRDGFGTYVKNSFGFVGNGYETELEDVSLFELINITVNSLEVLSVVKQNSGFRAQLEMNININSASPDQGFRYYLSNDNNVSNLNYLSTGTIGATNSIKDFTIRPNSNQLAFYSDKAFLVLYPCFECSDYYVDDTYGNNVYYNVNSENETKVEITIPK